jgi:OOP family OmpA-OmpF porin
VLDAAELTRNPDGTYQWSNKDKKMENGVELDCRDRPEDFDKIEDEDGCPDVLIFDNCQIKLTDKIYFKFNKWDIDPKSFKLLDEVRDTLNAAPDIKMWIDGHTDSKGSDKYNKTLSQKRVDSVKKHLVEKGGIDPSRLEPRGLGESVPIQDNKTADGRAANRRVEFNLKDCVKKIQ